jgi:hypothetical protein
MIKYFTLLLAASGVFAFYGCRKNDLRFKDPAQRIDSSFKVLLKVIFHFFSASHCYS